MEDVGCISEDSGLCEYICSDCGNIFTGVRIGISLKCPDCRSANTKIMFY